jgi:hypothetical protein
LISLLKDPSYHAKHTRGGYSFPKKIPLPDFKSVFDQLQIIGKTSHEEISQISLALVPTGMTPFFGKEKLFGAKVFDLFPDARYEITEAGNCLASGLASATDRAAGGRC